MNNGAAITRLKQEIAFLTLQQANIHVHGILQTPKGAYVTEDFDSAVYDLNMSLTGIIHTRIGEQIDLRRAELHKLIS